MGDEETQKKSITDSRSHIPPTPHRSTETHTHDWNDHTNARHTTILYIYDSIDDGAAHSHR